MLFCSNSIGIVDCIWSNRPKMDFSTKQFIISFGSSWANTVNNVIIVTSCVCICRWLVFIRAHSFLLAFTHIHDGEAAQIAHRWEESKISQRNKNLNLSILFAYVWLSMTFRATFNDNFFENMLASAPLIPPNCKLKIWFKHFIFH